MVMNSEKNNLFLISLHRKSLYTNYKKSVENQIPIKKLTDHGIEITHKDNAIGVWGIVTTEDNIKIWKKIKKSDIIIFLHNKKFFSKTKVINIAENNKIPKRIWSDSPFIDNRNLLIFLEKTEPLCLEYNASIPILIEPRMSDAHYFAIMKINKEKRDFLAEIFGSIDNAIDFLAGSENKNLPISDYLTKMQLEEEVKITTKHGMSKQRLGQQQFRKNILLNFGNKCAVCRLDDEELLEAAHIIPIENKKLAGKTNNGICLCANCHKMFDRGFFSFNNDYEIIISRKKKISNNVIKLLKNNKMGKFKIALSKEYLTLHRTKFGISP